jgi:amino acid adenylation domain-containing protein
MTESLHTIAVDFDPFGDAPQRTLLPLTAPQKEIWAAAQMGDDASRAYNLCYALRLRGPLSPESLHNALQLVIERHAALRVTLESDGERQAIAAALPATCPLQDLSGLNPDERASEIAAILEHEAMQPFDLERGPLLRARLVREATDAHRLILSVHHIVCDGWSSAVLLEDLSRAYAADRHGLPAQLPAPASYAEYVAGMVAREREAHADEDYWAEQYADSIPVLDLPLDRPRSAPKRYAGAIREMRLDETLCRALKAAGAKNGCTLFMTLLAAYEVLLSRLSSQDDFVVGVPMAGQALLENRHLVAHCVHLVPLRARVDSEARFVDHLRALRQRFLDAQSHQRLTFGALLHRLDVPRDPARTPLVSVTFNIDRIGAPFDFGELELLGVDSAPKRFVNFELSFNVIDNGRDLLVECEYATALRTPETIDRWLRHFGVLLEALAAAPERRVGELPLLSDAERRRLLDAGDARVSYPKDSCLHERFERQVKSTPDATALVCETQKLTYRELNARANQLAHRLRRLGVRPDQLVGLRTERGPELVIGIIGILKSGAAYLPLDPAQPRERIAFMIEDSAAGVVVTQQVFADDFEGLPITAVILDPGFAEPDTDLQSVNSPESLAYSIYTSGSMGEPKGVLITHYNVTRLFDATSAWYGFGRDDAWTVFHSYAFDFSVWEIWGALLYGGRLVVVPYWISRSPEAFRDLLLREKITVLNQTPSAFRELIAADQAKPLARFALRYVIFGGEALDLQTLRPWIDRHGDRHPLLVNMYGITETTVHVTYRPVVAHDVHSGRGSLIGRPIPDLRLYILDRCGEPTAIGVTGELYVGGAGVARGYLNRPELTAERFVADPFQEGGGAVLYRTGDLARRLQDGDIEYLGRIDDQVKIRGYRVELGEIEAVLLKHPDIRDATVLAREDVPGEKRLVAYFVAKNQTDDLVDQLRRRIRATLPEYMVPAYFVPLTALPLTRNGKLDRKSLPRPGMQLARRPLVPPRSAPEKLVARVFAEVLRRNDIGVHDNFFDLGGDSMSAARLMARLRASGTDLPLRNLFERPTVAELAQAVDAISWIAKAEAGGDGDDRECIEL